MPETAARPLLLILSSEIQPGARPGEFVARFAVRNLMQAGAAAGFQVVAGPLEMFHLELPAGGSARIVAEGRELRPAAGIIRATTGGGLARARMLDRAMRAQGCVMLDPEERLESMSYGKTDFLMTAQGSGHDIDRAIVSSQAELERRLRAHDYARRGKLVAKPLEGSGGLTVRWVDGSPASIEAVREVIRGFGGRMPPYVVEPALDIAREFRILTLDGELLGSIRRIAPGPERAPQVSRGGTALAEPAPPAMLDAIGRLMRPGLIGWDVVETRDGRTVVIEMNRPPTWKSLQKMTGIDIGARIVAHLRARMAAAAAG